MVTAASIGDKRLEDQSERQKDAENKNSGKSMFRNESQLSPHQSLAQYTVCKKKKWLMGVRSVNCGGHRESIWPQKSISGRHDIH